MFTPAIPAAADLLPLIDHTLLKPETTAAMVARLCEEARFYGFASVCVLPWWLSEAVRRLAGSPVRPCTVAGFPLGAYRSEIKAAEAARAAAEGAREIDMVMAVGAFKEGSRAAVARDIEGVVRAAGPAVAVKVILETTLLDPAEIPAAARLAVDAGAAFVKTSTGFFGGATVEAVRLMREAVGARAGVKASGGIRTADEARLLIRAGANRLGTSAGVAIATKGD